MRFLAPALLVGLLGLALPFVAHLLGTPKPVQRPFAAVRFLPRGEPTVTQRRSMRDIALLVIRSVLVVLIVLTLSRPTLRAHGDAAAVAETQDAMLLLDGSRSTGLRVAGRSVLEHELLRAEEILAAMPTGSRVGLVTSDPQGPRLEPNADFARIHTALRRWLAEGAPRPGAWKLADTLGLASSMLVDAGTADRPRYIYAIGDLTLGGLVGTPTLAEGGTPVLHVPALAMSTLPEHVAITDARWEAAPDLGSGAVRVHCTVRRFIDGADALAPTRDVSVALLIEGKEVARATATVPVDEAGTVEFTHTLLESDAPLAATLRLVDHGEDPLASDDERHFWLSADFDLDVLIVNGDPSELRAHDEVFFLTTAAASTDQAQLHGMALDQLELSLRERGIAALEDTDVLVLANVRAPAPDTAGLLVEAVEQGLGLWITAGDRIDPEDYNRRLGSLLPLPLRDVVQVGTAPGRSEAQALGLAPPSLDHPIFRGIHSRPGLAGVTARRILLLEPVEPTTLRAPAIALSFTSGAPALLTRDAGDGRVALLTTSVDRDWSDLPLRPGFVPLVAGTLAYLGGAKTGGAGEELYAGQVRTISSTRPLVLRRPDREEVALHPERGEIRIEETYTLGHYQIRRGDEPIGWFEVNVDASESETVVSTLPEGERPADRERSLVAQPRWRELAFLVALLLAFESLVRWWMETRTRA